MRLSLMDGKWREIELQLSKIKDHSTHFIKTEPLSGGCINQAWKVTNSNNKQYFIKTNSPELESMFIAEAHALQEIAKNASIRTPDVILHGCTAKFSYLVLEYISLKPLTNQKKIGEQLAQMHQTTSPFKQFGWTQNNYIGSTLQSNKTHESWSTFWRDERLLYQLNLAKNKGYATKAYDAGLKLAELLPLFFTDYSPTPSLLHGDLWGGNCASDMNDNPVIYDPAMYYGDREADIAMTELFGGFNTDFYNAYENSFAVDSGYKTRKNLYNLYHILNHFNLYGSGYASQAESMTNQLLSEV